MFCIVPKHHKYGLAETKTRGPWAISLTRANSFKLMVRYKLTATHQIKHYYKLQLCYECD